MPTDSTWYAAPEFHTAHNRTDDCQLTQSSELYRIRIQTLLNNIARWTPVDQPRPAEVIRISNRFPSEFEVRLRPYVPLDETALTHIIFRGLEPGCTAPRAPSTAYALEDGTLTSEKIDRYCDNLANDIILSEAQQFGTNTLINHALLFAAGQVLNEDSNSRLQGVSPCIPFRTH